MLLLSEIRDWIKEMRVGDHFYIGKLDNSQEKAIGIYQRKSEQPLRMAIGGRNIASYDVKSVSILVHWNKNAKETEINAQNLFNRILESKNIVIGKTLIQYIQLESNEPIDVGTDDANVYERVIPMNIYYQLNERE